MQFSFSDDQLALRDAVRDLLAKECPPAAVRAAWTSPTGRCAPAWNALTEMGVLGVVVPETAGGLGLDEIDLVLVLEETGRSALPEPIVETAAVVAPMLAARGDERAAELVAGASAAATHALSPHAVWADTASVIVAMGSSQTVVAPREAFVLGAVDSVDGARRLFELEVAGAVPSGAPQHDESEVDLAFDRAALGTAAQLNGLADRMITMTVEYASARKQFGVAIGTFQAVKHHLANARLALEFARPLAYRAASTIANDDADRAVAVSLAKASASDAATLAARVALQCHGAIGYTTEYDLHLFMKRTWALAATWGDAAWHRARIGRAIL
ncbi:MAG TPA: acyl-CoA dehydrogenase family protein [Acidimicrobiia bacterium]|nr:acyl-CoA dehydrogenase family protein [Acidimicrobiia bacterium]